MQATLTWLDLTASDRDKMRRVLDLFKEQGTLDEMGLGSLRAFGCAVSRHLVYPDPTAVCAVHPVDLSAVGRSKGPGRRGRASRSEGRGRFHQPARTEPGQRGDHRPEGSGPPAEDVWEDPDALRATERIRDILELARRFSLHVEGVPLLYNLLVAERRRDVLDSDENEAIDEFRAGLTEWAAREANEDRPFEPDALWVVVRRGGRLPYPQRLFIESWSRRIAELGSDRVADDDRLRILVTERELRLKGARARLANRNRLMDWTPGVGVGRMDFRWFRVRKFMSDLHRGFAA